MTNQEIFNAMSEHEQQLFYAMSADSENQALREAHAAAKAALEAFHKATGCINQGQAKRPMVDALQVLDELDAFRRRHQDSRKDPIDWCMRVMEAILAKAAGYKSRCDWTDALRADESTTYRKDLKENPFFF